MIFIKMLAMLCCQHFFMRLLRNMEEYGRMTVDSYRYFFFFLCKGGLP